MIYIFFFNNNKQIEHLKRTVYSESNETAPDLIDTRIYNLF